MKHDLTCTLRLLRRAPAFALVAIATLALGIGATVIEQQANPQLAAVLKAGDYRTLIDNSTVDRLVKEGFFQKLFGPSIRAEEERKAKLAFR